MSIETVSETLFQEFCRLNAVPCSRVAEEDGVRTPDFDIELGGVPVTCEVKQIDLNDEDREELAEAGEGVVAGRYVPNRFRKKLRGVSAQLKSAAAKGRPTLLVIYDNTPFKAYTHHSDVVQAMFGRNSVLVSKVPAPLQVSKPFFGGDRGLGPTWNTAVSAIAILDGGSTSPPPLALRVYHNPYAKVRLDPSVFDSLPVTQPVRPDATQVSL